MFNPRDFLSRLIDFSSGYEGEGVESVGLSWEVNSAAGLPLYVHLLS